MARYAALIRGINVGKGNRIAMAELRKALEDTGFSQVSTLLASGNVVFSGEPDQEIPYAERIRHVLQNRFSIDVPVVVKSEGTFKKCVDEHRAAVDEAAASRTLLIFAQDPPRLLELRGLEAQLGVGERFHLGQETACLTCAPSIHESQAAAVLMGRRGQLLTSRNWATVLKILAMLTGE
jgi:uncharacterized protein (DUF1697 family)